MNLIKPYVLIIIVLLIFISALLIYYYTVNIYEVMYEVEPANLYADHQSQITIEAVPLNALGFRAYFRNAPAEFEIIEGADLVEIIKTDDEKGILILRAKVTPGTVVIRITSKYALLPSEVKVMVYTNTA